MSALNSTVLNFVAGESDQFVTGAIGTAAILATITLYYVLNSKDKEHGFPKLPGVQLYHAWNFFQRRYDFLWSNFNRNPGKNFSFNVLHHNVIALTGQDARRVFFSDSHLNPQEGYRLLMGGAPRISNMDIATEGSKIEGNLPQDCIFLRPSDSSPGGIQSSHMIHMHVHTLLVFNSKAESTLIYVNMNSFPPPRADILV